MNRRGLTLTEVLVAIFVTGLGLMALMTLFPLGAMNMSQAIKDDRAQQAAANATATLRVLWRQGLDTESYNVTYSPANPPDQTLSTFLRTGQPVYLDPIGSMTYAGGGGPVGGVIQRIMPTYLSPPSNVTFALAMQRFALMDDIHFDPNGNAAIPHSGVLEREYLYSWAYMLRPPPQALATPPTPILPPRLVNFAVVVYGRRFARYANVGSLGGENVPISAQFFAGLYGSQKTIVVPAGTNAVKGNWVLDCTPGNPNNPIPDYQTTHSYFYRIDSVSTSGNTMMLKTDQPIRGWETLGSQGLPGSGVLVFMYSVVEVLEKSTLE